MVRVELSMHCSSGSGYGALGPSGPASWARIGAAVGFCLYVMRVDLAFDPRSNL